MKAGDTAAENLESRLGYDTRSPLFFFSSLDSCLLPFRQRCVSTFLWHLFLSG